MENTIILYQSKYGATKQYATWLAEKLDCQMVETKSAKINEVAKYDTIILGGGIYASGIAGISFLKKNYEKLKDKKIAVFAVGASPYDKKSMNELYAHNLKGEMANIPCFYCRGAWMESLMTFRDKALCKMLKSSLSKKDPDTYEPWEAALVEAIGSDADFTDEKNLEPILDFVRNIHAEEHAEKDETDYEQNDDGEQNNDSMMDESKFWKYISLIDCSDEDEDLAVEDLVTLLSNESVSEINSFDERLSYYLYMLDTMEHAKNIGDEAYIDDSEYFSPDNFLYVRCSVVANGKKTYNEILRNPKNMLKDEWFEILLEVPALAFEEKTDDEYDYITKYDYETFSNKDGWK